MEDFRLIYRILNFLNETKKHEKFDYKHFNNNHFSANSAEWISALEMLTDSGYIKGIVLNRAADGHCEISLSRPRITLSGIEYFNRNEFMLQVSAQVKGCT